MFSGCKLINTDITEFSTKLREKVTKCCCRTDRWEWRDVCVGKKQFARGTVSSLKQGLLCVSRIGENS